MSIATIFDRLTTAQRERREAKEISFEQLVLQVANDVNLYPDEVADQLDQLGRTAEELSNAAQLIVDRRQLAARLRDDEKLVAEHNRLHAEEQAANAELDEAIRRAKAAHAQRVTPIQTRLATIATTRDAIQTARTMLTRTSPHHARLSKLLTERGEALIALQDRLPRELRQAKPADVGYWQGEIRRTQAKADQLAVEISQLEQEAIRP